MTKAEAEAAGWFFPHYGPDGVRAEKYQDGKLINEHGRDEEQVLVQVAAYEDHLASLVGATPAIPALDTSDPDDPDEDEAVAPEPDPSWVKKLFAKA